MDFDHSQRKPDLHNPFHKFKIRNEAHHHAEDDSRLCATHQISTQDVIENFMNFRTDTLDLSIPRRNQAVRDFLNEATVSGLTQRSLDDDIIQSSSSIDIALVDDRQKHARCPKLIGSSCTQCQIFSEKVGIAELYARLKADRLAQKAEKRIIFIPNPTSAHALCLASTVSRRTTIPLRDFLQRYLRRQHRFSISMTWGFFLEFHIPYYALRRGLPIPDHRKRRDKPLRTYEELPLRSCSKDKELLFVYEAQTSSLTLGPDEDFWTEYCFVDTYFGSEEKLHEYFSNCNPGEGFDPPLGGVGKMDTPCYDPREYYLKKLERRVRQVTRESTSLVDTFDERIEDYEKEIAKVFEDDKGKSHTRTLSDVIAKIQLFAGCMKATIDAWDTFYKTQISLFTIFGEQEWQSRIDNIVQNIVELDRLRGILLTKQHRFESKLASLSTVSSLIEATEATRQTEAAILQGNNIKILTQMTVYTAFPLHFTAAIFSMGFIKPKYPWLAFFSVLFVTSIINYMIASHRSPFRRWLRRPLRNRAYRSMV